MPSEFVQRGWVTRAASAASRRWTARWGEWRHGPHRHTAELALEWLVREAQEIVATQRALAPDDRRAAERRVAQYGEYELASRIAVGERLEPERPKSPPASAAALALQALADYRSGRHAEADRALAQLRRTQRADGSWPAENQDGRPGSIAAACAFLTAQEAQIRATFARHGEWLETIDERDGRWQAIAAWLASAPGLARVAEIGCGSGRYLRRIVESGAFTYGRASVLLGIDPSREAQRLAPREAIPVVGGWPRLPLADGACDAAFTVEALEHTLVPRRAVAELCRVVRPGGRILVIDKHAADQRLSHCQPWERWFECEEIIAWLAPWCREIDARGIAHGPHRAPTGLFWCWTAVRT